jgi:hypothetical protein
MDTQTASPTRTCNLVATHELLSTAFPDLRPARTTVASADFSVDPALCKTKFGAWLAEHVPTTRFDDDWSRISITLRVTEEALHWRAMGERLQRTNPGNALDLEAVAQEVESFIAKRRKVFAMHGDAIFQRREFDYDWPVLGSARCPVTTAEEFFDHCAKHIRSMKPVDVRAWDGARPPESLQVCEGA